MSGVRASYKGHGFDVDVGYKVADVAAMAAIGIGAAGTFLPEISTTLVGLPLLATGLGYFGVKATKPDLLPAFARNNPEIDSKTLMLIGGAGLALVWWQKKQAEQAALDRIGSREVVVAPRPTVVMPSRKELQPKGSTHVVVPSGDSNYAWWPKSGAKKNPQSWIAWMTGAGEGEGYLPDDWPIIGTKAGASDAAKQTVITAAEAAGAGAAKAAGITEDKPLIPRWLVPTMGIGGLVLAGYWVYKH